MHRCLSIPEMVLSIAQALVKTSDTDALACLAVTDRYMYKIVNPVLWSELTCIAPLLQLFPSDAWAYEERKIDEDDSAEDEGPLLVCVASI